MDYSIAQMDFYALPFFVWDMRPTVTDAGMRQDYALYFASHPFFVIKRVKRVDTTTRGGF